ncbi:MAG TPA: ABC transporter substrate-binding protein, partial [Dehalococcoidia bacterium]
GPSGGGAGADQGSVNVLGIWGGSELDSFNAMVAGWNGKVNFTGSREITSLLSTRVEGGNPPDVALPAEIGLFQRFAREGKLTPLSKCQGLEDQLKANYPQSFLDLGTIDGTLYGFFMKADSKATIWYNPKFFQSKGYKPLTADSKFDDLVALAEQIKKDGLAPFSMGIEAGAGSGFPASDVIQQIVLNDSGEKTYDAIVNGSTPFTDKAMSDAWEKYAKLALTQGYTAQGGAAGINATNFQDATYAPFQNPPRAAMVLLGGFGAGFIKTQFPNLKAGEDYDFMPWPGGGVTGGANIAYAFNGNPATCSFLSYLAGADAQSVWVKRGSFTSLNKKVDLNAYPDPVSKKLAEQLENTKTFRFDLDDAIGGAAQQAEFKGLVQYLQQPAQLQTILQGIQAVRKPN